jgi:glycosyltransferase involved in cell wall biosynthesis
MENKILVFITTYKRPEFLKELLKDILQNAGKHQIELLIFNDQTDSSYDDVYLFVKEKWPWQHSFIRFNKHFGKPRYWEMINEAFGYLKKLDFDYVIQLPDDVQLVDDFFNKAIETFESIPDKYKSCLNLLNDISRRGPLWTPIEPKLMRGHIIRTGWVDMCYIANKYFFEILNWQIKPVNKNWATDPERSSGVGKQISERIYINGTYFYQVITSLVIHGDHESVMHPTHRKKTPLITNYDISDVYCGVASMPEREDSLNDTVKSILPQVGKLFVYLNRYTRIPNFLKHAKIEAVLSNNAIGDIGDIGKFFFVDKMKGYCFTIDDDLIYPPDYVARYVSAIELHLRKAAITTHGRCFDNMPVKSYYHGHTKSFRCLGSQEKDNPVHVGGTGVMAFHTDHLNINIDDFKLSNMADIWFSKICSEQNVPIISISHKLGWIKESSKYDTNYTIYNFCNHNDSEQTEIINTVKFKKIS